MNEKLISISRFFSLPLKTSSSNRVIEAKNEIKSLNESVQILIKIFNKYKNIDLEISKGFLEQFYFISNEIKLHTTNRIGNEEYYDFDVEKLVETQEFEFLMDKLYLIVNFNSNHMTNEENQEDVNIKNKLRDYLQSLRVLTNLHTTNRIGNEEYNDFDVEKLVETQEFEFLMDKLYLIVNFNSNHMTNEENQEDVNIKNKLRDYLQSLRVLTNVLTLNIYKLKTTSINDEIINDWKERINVTKIIDVLFFNKENLDLGHDNLVSLNNPIEIVDDDNKIRKKKLYKNKFVAEQEIGFLPNRNDVKKLENELIKLKSLEKCQNILKYTSVLLNLSLDPILCDFGSVKYENPILFKSTKYQQDSRYTAPEVLKSDNSTYTRSSDVYSFSILLWEIAMQTFPFGKIDSNLIKNKILNDNERPQPNDFDKMEGIPKKYHKIMIQGWNSDVKKRPTIGEVRKDLIDCINSNDENNYDLTNTLS
ncbi:3670_t:CDS:2, partial [Entrophospora sp. SA101]